MKRVKFVSLSLIFVFFVGCSVSGSNNEPDSVQLRVVNKSSVDFSSVLVSFPGTEWNYGSVEAGQASKYHKFKTAYRYGYVEIKAKGKTYRIQPIDYVGEKPLENGYYSYKLTLAKGHLSGDIVQN